MKGKCHTSLASGCVMSSSCLVLEYHTVAFPAEASRPLFTSGYEIHSLLSLPYYVPPVLFNSDWCFLKTAHWDSGIPRVFISYQAGCCSAVPSLIKLLSPLALINMLPGYHIAFPLLLWGISLEIS